jgi:hypothetical protein
MERWPSHAWPIATAATWPPLEPERAAGEWHNVTPEQDYRTALLSDSPDAGCSLCLDVGEIAGTTRTRSPACGNPRAERSAAVVVATAVITSVSRQCTDAIEGPAGLQDGWPEARTSIAEGSDFIGLPGGRPR